MKILKYIEVSVCDSLTFKTSIATVNVIEVMNKEDVAVTSFPDTKDGNLEAKIYFHDIVRENYPEELEEDIEVAIENGCYTKDENYQILLVKSVLTV